MARSTARSTFAGRLSSSEAAVVRLGAGQDGAQIGHRGTRFWHGIGHRLVTAGAGSQLLDSAVELCLRLFHRGATGLHRS
jgi:hypothetical protein